MDIFSLFNGGLSPCTVFKHLYLVTDRYFWKLTPAPTPMTTWKQCNYYYNKVFNALQEYTKSDFKSVVDDSVLKNISIHILEKFYINLYNCIELIPRVEEKPHNFLSLGLIIRGMLPDIIQHRYLTQINEIGTSDFENKIRVMDYMTQIGIIHLRIIKGSRP